MKVDALGLPSETAEAVVSETTLTVDVALSLAFTEQVTVGSRASAAEAEKAVPVDIITREQIAASGYAETAQVIQSLTPSFNFPRPTITDGTDTVRPATLRGLGPDQVLVLVNGKRRHQSALVHLNNSIGRGSTGVDLNAIPVSAIDHIEVLRDGASAQYGSDAIAGVINIVLRSGASRPTVTSKFGLSQGFVHGEHLHTERAELRRRRRHRLRGRRALRRRRILGAEGRHGSGDHRRRIPAAQPHEPCVVRSARPDCPGRRGQQRGRRAQPSMGRSGHEGRDDVRGRERAVEQPADRAFSTASAATAGASRAVPGSTAGRSTRATGRRSIRSDSCR